MFLRAFRFCFLLLYFVQCTFDSFESGLKVEQDTALNEAAILYKLWLILSGICEDSSLLQLKVFTGYFIPSDLCS